MSNDCRTGCVLNIFFWRHSNLASDGMELSSVPWKRMTGGKRETACPMLGSCTLSAGECFFKSCSPSIMLQWQVTSKTTEKHKETTIDSSMVTRGQQTSYVNCSSTLKILIDKVLDYGNDPLV